MVEGYRQRLEEMVSTQQWLLYNIFKQSPSSSFVKLDATDEMLNLSSCVRARSFKYSLDITSYRGVVDAHSVTGPRAPPI